MTTHKVNSLLESIEGAALMGFHLLTPFLRPFRTRWGAVSNDSYRVLPGDELVPNPKWQFTHAITIHAPAAEVWKWLVQIGADRGGFYSYEGLENLAGCNVHNADRIRPELQNLKPGDEIRLHPKAPGMPVAEIEPGVYMLVHSNDHTENTDRYIHTTWLWYLDKMDTNTTRLIVRGRNDYSPELSNRLLMGPLLMEPVSFVMERKMLIEIRNRAERSRNLQPILAN